MKCLKREYSKLLSLIQSYALICTKVILTCYCLLFPSSSSLVIVSRRSNVIVIVVASMIVTFIVASAVPDFYYLIQL